MRKLLFLKTLALALLLLCSCGGKKGSGDRTLNDSVTFRYAQLLHIYNVGQARLVIIQNPWQPDKELHRYVLIPHDAKAGRLPQGDVVRIPLRRLTVFTSVHCSLLRDIGAIESISGVCDFEYINSPEIINRVHSGKIGNMGNALNPNVELILSRSTDGLLVSPFEQSGYGTLERTGLPLIECADYMEHSPLGRAEWVRFFGMLTGHEREADSLFNQVEKNYNRLCRLAGRAKEKPTLLSDFMNGAAWYVPGGGSTIGRIYQDAGANYLFASRKENGSVRLSFETVYQKGHNADVWFIKYGRAQDFNYRSLLAENPKYGQFKAYRQRRIFGCNTLRVPFYDEEPFHPDRLLSDVIALLHPDLLPDWKPLFFSPLDE